MQARFLTVDTEHVAYTSRENLAQQPSKYAVALLQEDGTLDVYPSLPVFRLQARVKGVSDELATPKGPVRLPLSHPAPRRSLALFGRTR